jgi:CheY-like chemotaxis protein
MTGDHILIVEDNDANRKLIRILLSSAGYQVTAASNAEEALALLEGCPPRLILMDLQLPGMDGLELTRRLKTNPATRDIIVLAITAYAMKGDDKRALQAGCNGYLSKPIDTRQLTTIVEQFLGTPPGR